MTRYLTFLFLILFGTSCGQTPSSEPVNGDFGHDLRLLLPQGVIEVDIMGFQMPDGYEELVQRFRMAIAENQEWFVEYAKTSKPGQGLDYHPNLGMTEEEWERLGDMTEQMRMGVSHSGVIRVAHTDSTITLVGAGDTEAFNGLSINLNTKRLSTEFASWDYTKAIKANENQDKTGPWDGYNWKYQEMDTAALTDLENMTGKDYDLSIGQLQESKKTIIFFRARVFANGYQNRLADILVTFDTPRKEE